MDRSDQSNKISNNFVFGCVFVMLCFGSSRILCIVLASVEVKIWKRHSLTKICYFNFCTSTSLMKLWPQKSTTKSFHESTIFNINIKIMDFHIILVEHAHNAQDFQFYAFFAAFAASIVSSGKGINISRMLNVKLNADVVRLNMDTGVQTPPRFCKATMVVRTI